MSLNDFETILNVINSLTDEVGQLRKKIVELQDEMETQNGPQKLVRTISRQNKLEGKLASVDDFILNLDLNTGALAVREIRHGLNNKLTIVFEDRDGKRLHCATSLKKLKNFGYQEGEIVELENFSVTAETVGFRNTTTILNLNILDNTIMNPSNLRPLPHLFLERNKWSDGTYIAQKEGYHMIVKFHSLGGKDYIRAKNLDIFKINFISKDSKQIEYTIWDAKDMPRLQINEFYEIKGGNVNKKPPFKKNKLYFNASPATTFDKVILHNEERGPRSSLMVERIHPIMLADISEKRIVNGVFSIRVITLQKPLVAEKRKSRIVVTDASTNRKAILIVNDESFNCDPGTMLHIERCEITPQSGIVAITAESNNIEVGDPMEIMDVPTSFLQYEH